MYVVSMVMVLATPVLAMTLLLIVAQRYFGFADLRSVRRRRSAAVSAPVLVLPPSRGLHHDSAGDGRGVGSVRLLRPPAGVRLHLHGVRALDDRRRRLHGVGPPHVRRRPVAAGQSRLLVSVLHRRGAFGHQGVQLDGDALPRSDRLRGADDLCARLPRPVHHRRPHRPVPGVGADRYRRDGFLFRRGPFPHHHGRRHGVGLHVAACITGGQR